MEKTNDWTREDEQNLNAVLGFIDDEYLRRWLKDALRVRYDKQDSVGCGEWGYDKCLKLLKLNKPLFHKNYTDEELKEIQDELERLNKLIK